MTRKTKERNIEKRKEEENLEEEKTGIRGRGARALVVALAPREDNTQNNQTDPGRHITPLLMRRGPPSHETKKLVILHKIK